MTSILIATSFVAAGLALGVAQTPAPQAPAPPTPGVMVTVVGCLTSEKVTPKEAAMPGSTSSAKSDADVAYVLTDQAPPATALGGVTPASTPAGATSSGATASGMPPPARKMYVLRTMGTTVDLTKHVNHTVRVTGATTAPMTTAPLAGRSPEATPNPGTTAPAGSTGTMFDTANLPTLAVTTLTMVAPSCKASASER